MGLGSGIRKKPIPDPGSRGQKGIGSRIPDPGPQQWVQGLGSCDLQHILRTGTGTLGLLINLARCFSVPFTHGGGRGDTWTRHVRRNFKKRSGVKIYLGLRMAYSGRQLFCGKPTKDDGVDSAQAHRGQHGNYGLGHHGHVDEHPVPLHHAQSGQQASHLGHLIFQLPVGQLVLPEMNHTEKLKIIRGFTNT
jgi:hypothetical protein